MKLTLLLALLALTVPAAAWGNGFSIYVDPFAYNDPVFVDSPDRWKNTNNYGTHDYLAERAWEMLEEVSPEEAEWLTRLMYTYGTELPDSINYKESIGDLKLQYLRFDESGNVIDDSLAKKSMKRYDLLIGALEREEWGTASKHAGTIAAYVSNAGLFSRVIDNPQKGVVMEAYLLRMTDIVYPSDEFDEVFGEYIKFDGTLEMISPYDATMKIGRATYLGRKDESCSAEWMDKNYDTEDSEFIECTGRNLNNIINALVDVLHTAYQHGVEGNEYDMEAYDWENFKGYSVPEPEPEPEPETEVINDSPAEEPVAAPPKQPDEDIYEPEYVPAPKKREEGGIWVFAILAVVLAAVLLMTFRKMGHKSQKKGLKDYKSKRYTVKKKKK